MTQEQIGELAALATAVLWTLSALAWTAAGKHVGALGRGFSAAAVGRGNAHGLRLLSPRIGLAVGCRPPRLAGAGHLGLPGVLRLGPLPVQGVPGHRAAAVAAGDLAHAAHRGPDIVDVARQEPRPAGLAGDGRHAGRRAVGGVGAARRRRASPRPEDVAVRALSGRRGHRGPVGGHGIGERRRSPITTRPHRP